MELVAGEDWTYGGDRMVLNEIPTLVYPRVGQENYSRGDNIQISPKLHNIQMIKLPTGWVEFWTTLYNCI